jgi:hypothetical protein
MIRARFFIGLGDCDHPVALQGYSTLVVEQCHVGADRPGGERMKRGVDIGIHHIDNVGNVVCSFSDSREYLLVTLETMSEIPLDHCVRVVHLFAVTWVESLQAGA